jgi:hypothetical protein
MGTIPISNLALQSTITIPIPNLAVSSINISENRKTRFFYNGPTSSKFLQ